MMLCLLEGKVSPMKASLHGKQFEAEKRHGEGCLQLRHLMFAACAVQPPVPTEQPFQSRQLGKHVSAPGAGHVTVSPEDNSEARANHGRVGRIKREA